jgi:hypothetical protein
MITHFDQVLQLIYKSTQIFIGEGPALLLKATLHELAALILKIAKCSYSPIQLLITAALATTTMHPMMMNSGVTDVIDDDDFADVDAFVLPAAIEVK